MILTKEDLIKKIKDDPRNTNWVMKGGNRSRIRSLFKREKFSISEIEYLWTVEQLRYEIIRSQTVSKRIIKLIIQKKAATKKGNTSIFVGMLVNQKMTKEIIEYIEHRLKYSDSFFISWKIIPETMNKLGSFDNLIDSIDSVTSLGFNNDSSFSALVNASKLGNDKLKAILFKLVDKKYNMGNFLSAIAKSIYLEDDIIDLIKNSDGVEELLYFSFMEKVISRNNCSLNKKALFYLEM